MPFGWLFLHDLFGLRLLEGAVVPIGILLVIHSSSSGINKLFKPELIDHSNNLVL